MLWQSQRHHAYREALRPGLHEQGLSYYCTCTRARIQSIGGIYDGHCRDLHHGPENAAVRLRQQHPVTHFSDRLRGIIIATKNWHGKILLFIAAMGCSPTTWRWWSMITFRIVRNSPRRRPD